MAAPFPLNTYLVGDCRDLMAKLPDDSIDCVVTSPPYWGLRDYGIEPVVWDGNPP
jgi:DNA modification methylase